MTLSIVEHLYNNNNIVGHRNCKKKGNCGRTRFGHDVLYPPVFRFIAAVVDQFQFQLHLTANLRDLLLLSPRVLHQQLLLWRPREGPSISLPYALGIIVRGRHLPDRQIEQPVQMDLGHVSFCNDTHEKCPGFHGVRYLKVVTLLTQLHFSAT